MTLGGVKRSIFFFLHSSCLLWLPLFVGVLCLVIVLSCSTYCPFLVLQPSRGGRESRLLYFDCILVVMWLFVFCAPSSRCRGFRAEEIPCQTCPTCSNFIQDKLKISIYLSLDKCKICIKLIKFCISYLD